MTGTDVVTARDRGLVACTRCTRVWPMDTETCARCGSTLRSRRDRHLQRVWAWLSVGIVCYIPANLYPMLKTRTLFVEQDSTIIAGAVEIAQHGGYGIALVILVASVLIPIGKFISIAYLALSLKRQVKMSRHRRHQLYEVVEFIGRWSMIDVFVVAILSSLVQLSAIASINPGPAAITFALSVIFTMLAALSFDPRMIWDGPEDRQE
ncbi:paraquat-inducible protein A [Oceaniovalibus sp. ACAM 378]|uniref:paraquat-inducible protein A n=1 Tax=Oceaniovalibus sp. ACAM 378 TaxID=2599923 RepID=UPI0011DC10D2|nr:paraquat-inducible protein A [Oceaniovalibus sp. ACAM 378]TYB87035.1 paraquat-inducible membrane protein A [Oceaniovalibus sp. ACAM 378]